MLIASPLPARIRKDNPDVHISWLVDGSCAPVLQMNPHIDRILPFDWQAVAQLSVETFDAVYSFERTPAAAALVDRVAAAHKAGLAYGGSHNGLYAMGESAKHFFKMNLWNDYRTRQNTKTWTELYFEVAGFRYEGEPYVLRVPADAESRVRAFLADGADAPWICFNLGGSLPIKKWPLDHWLTLGRALLGRGYQIVITGGSTEAADCEALQTSLSALVSYPRQVRYTSLSIEEFSAVPGCCDVVITGDSFGFHTTLAHQRPCVLLLGPSSGSEVIPKHVANVTALRSTLACSPCAHQVSCGGIGGCMDMIPPSQVHQAVENHLAQGRKYAGALPEGSQGTL